MNEDHLLSWILRNQMSETNTGGGGYVGGDANTRRFTGRDDSGQHVEVNLNRDGYQPPHPLSLASRVEEIEDAIKLIKQDLYGSAQSGILGVIKRLDRQFHQSQINMILSGLTLFVVLVLAVAIIGLYWGS